MGRRFSNCMVNYLTEALDERSCFAIAEKGKASAVVHLRSSKSGWMLDDLYGPENEPPHPSLEQEVEAYLGLYGIDREHPRYRHRKWRSLRRMIDIRGAIIIE